MELPQSTRIIDVNLISRQVNLLVLVYIDLNIFQFQGPALTFKPVSFGCPC